MHRIFIKEEPCNLSKNFVKSLQAHTRLTLESTFNTFASPFAKLTNFNNHFFIEELASRTAFFIISVLTPPQNL